ncbi:hypothetical protein [Nonomuraea sp. NPDC050310]|uniref:hypothetical protein n=1 Tax=unclassified Nonomuraea TaxID=2593643 RepID=UPI0033DEBDED
MNDFDFLEGKWTSKQRYLKKRLAGCDEWEEFTGTTVATRHFGGAACVDEVYFPERGTSGLTLRLYNPETELWSIYWASSKTGVLDTVPAVGRFEGDRGEFYADEFHEGTPIICRFVWTVQDADHCSWEQAFSTDQGKTWEVNWVADFTRA